MDLDAREARVCFKLFYQYRHVKNTLDEAVL